MNFVTTHILPRSVEYATRDVIWEPIVELQNLLQGHYYGQPIYKYDVLLGLCDELARNRTKFFFILQYAGIFQPQ